MLWGCRRRIAEWVLDPRGVLKVRQASLPPVNLAGSRDIEWSWIAANMQDGGGDALDFGNGGSPLGLVAAIRGYSVTAVDVQGIQWPYRHERLHFLQGDILKLDLPLSSFDLVTNCSTVEHVGLSGRYGVVDERSDGDLAAMDRLRALMKHEGRMLLTVPVGRDAVFAPMCRVYGERRLPQLVGGFRVTQEQFWLKDDRNRWMIVDRTTALDYTSHGGSGDPLRDWYGLGCFVLVAP